MKIKKAILITGAAGGLGKAIVEACVSVFPEHRVIATDISKDILDIFEDREQIIPFEMDVTNDESITSIREKIETLDLIVVGIVNNAGVSDFFPISETDSKTLEQMFAINTFGPVNMVRAFLPHLIETRGRVVNISSESVRLPAAFHPYANTKIAMEALSVSMRNELALYGAKLSIIRPGAINTPFLDDLHGLKNRIGESVYKDPLLKFATKAPGEIHRIVEPEKVAAVVVKALSRKRPKRYYRINNNPKLRIAQLLPHRLRDYFMMKMLK